MGRRHKAAGRAEWGAMAAPLAGSAGREKKGLDSGSVGNVDLLIQAAGEMGFWSLPEAQAGAPIVELVKQA